MIFGHRRYCRKLLHLMTCFGLFGARGASIRGTVVSDTFVIGVDYYIRLVL